MHHAAVQWAVTLAMWAVHDCERACVQGNYDLSVRFDTQMGDEVRVVGSHAALGLWDAGRAARMAWSEGGVWDCEVELPAGTVQEYKYVVCGPDGAVKQWQEGNNGVIPVPLDAREPVTLQDSWGGPSQSAGKLGAKLSGWVKDMERLVEGSRAEVRQVQMELAEKNEELARTVARAEKEVGAARAETKAARLELTAAVSDKEAAVAAKEQALLDLEAEIQRAAELEEANRELKTKLHESTTIFQETLTACQDLLNGENDALDLHAVLLDEARGGVEKPTNSAR